MGAAVDVSDAPDNCCGLALCLRRQGPSKEKYVSIDGAVAEVRNVDAGDIQQQRVDLGFKNSCSTSGL